MGSITGFGGAFVRANDPAALYAWYEKHLGISSAKGCFVFPAEGQRGSIAVSFFKRESSYFPASQPAMLNFQVDGLQEILDRLQAAGTEVGPPPEDSDFGKFGWFVDPEGNRVELWEPATSASQS